MVRQSNMVCAAGGAPFGAAAARTVVKTGGAALDHRDRDQERGGRDGGHDAAPGVGWALLATAYAVQGEPVRASVVGGQALDLTVRLTSARSVRACRTR
ncbi:MAG: hypothetical protein ACRDN0_18075 [Trebonia sp.]